MLLSDLNIEKKKVIAKGLDWFCAPAPLFFSLSLLSTFLLYVPSITLVKCSEV